MVQINSRRGIFFAPFVGALILCLAGGCEKPAATAAAAAVPDVKVATVEQKDVPETQEWVGYLDGFVNAQIRAQVSGTLLKQDYQDGSAVKAGQRLFEIDSRPFDAALAEAKGQLAQVQAQYDKAAQDVARDTPLAQPPNQAVSQEQLDNAKAAQIYAAAQIASANAAIAQAQLNLDFTTITSPIDGFAGLTQTQIGNLVGPATSVLTTVSTLDPIKAYFPVSEQAYLAFRARAPGAPGIPANLAFQLVLSNGSVYPLTGTFSAIDRQVDTNTGTLRVEALFPNPDGLLRPGQFARIRAVVKTTPGALLVPTRALTELQGTYQLTVVDGANHAHIVSVTVGPILGAQRVIASGVKVGDRVVVEGLQKAKEDAVVNPLPYTPTVAAK